MTDSDGRKLFTPQREEAGLSKKHCRQLWEQEHSPRRAGGGKI